MNFYTTDLTHDAYVTEAAHAIGAAQRAVVAAAYGDFASFAAAEREHFYCLNRMGALEARLDALLAEERRRNGQSLDGWFKNPFKAVAKAVSSATSAVKQAGRFVAKTSTTVFQPIEKVLPKGVVNVGKAMVNVALVPTQIMGGLLTDPKRTVKSAPGKIFATPLTSAMKITAEVGKIAPSSTAIGAAARKTEQSATQLQNYANAHPLQTIGAAAAVATIAVGGYLAAPYLISAAGSVGTTVTATTSAVTGTVASAGASATAALTPILGAQGAAAAVAAGAGMGGKLLVDAGKGIVSGGSKPPAYTEQTQAALDARGIQTGQPQAPGGMVPLLAGAGAGFMVGGPIGALIGAGAGMVLARRQA